MPKKAIFTLCLVATFLAGLVAGRYTVGKTDKSRSSLIHVWNESGIEWDWLHLQALNDASESLTRKLRTRFDSGTASVAITPTFSGYDIHVWAEGKSYDAMQSFVSENHSREIGDAQRTILRDLETGKDKPPNQSPEPTPGTVTPRADARVAPVPGAAHL